MSSCCFARLTCRPGFPAAHLASKKQPINRTEQNKTLKSRTRSQQKPFFMMLCLLLLRGFWQDWAYEPSLGAGVHLHCPHAGKAFHNLMTMGWDSDPGAKMDYMGFSCDIARSRLPSHQDGPELRDPDFSDSSQVSTRTRKDQAIGARVMGHTSGPVGDEFSRHGWFQVEETT